MILEFSNLDTFRLALTSGLIPPEVGAAPVTAALGEKGTVWVEPSVKLAYSAQKELTRFGVHTVSAFGMGETFSFLCWAQILPLRRETEPKPVTSQTPVLFELPGSHLLPALVGEMLRLGNDRQSFRYLKSANDTPTRSVSEGEAANSPSLTLRVGVENTPANESAAVLLRVIGPPYYSLLQALERDGQTPAPRAYLEAAPGVWVAVGFTHPLLEWIKPPAGRLLFLREPRDWWLVDDAPFRDIYEILEFQLPHTPASWRDAELEERLPVPLRLVPGGGSEPAEMWVLRGDGTRQLETFVRNSSDQLLSRLSFAVGESDGEKCVVLRVRPSRQAPPVLVLEGQTFRSYLKLPNLFVPCGKLLLPQLRRGAVQRLLAEDPEQITWLSPHADGLFTPETVPDQVFRPLTDWVEYVLHISRAPLQAWMDAAQFDFERFICKEDHKPERKPRDKEGKEPRKPKTQAEDGADAAGKHTDFKVKKGERPPAEDVDPLEMLPALEPSVLQQRQQELEAQFMRIDGPLDAPERQTFWPELAQVYAAQNNLSDAAVCWANALWEEQPEAGRQIAIWHHANLGEQRGQPAEQVLEKLLQTKEPDSGEVRLLASFILRAAHADEPEPALVQRLNRVQNVLQKHERVLPARLVWLIGQALHRLSGGDVLVLARTRDRLLARLFETGLTADLDLPGFLRFSGSGGVRFQAFRDWVVKLPERVRQWLTKVNLTGTLGVPGETMAYADLILAFGFARLSERELAQTLCLRAKRQIASRDDVHASLQGAFSHRIDQALAGQPPVGPLPAAIHEFMERMERQPRYVVDKLRLYSRILEPHEKIDPYRAWQCGYRDDLGKQLATLTDIHDAHELQKTIAGLLGRHPKKDAAGRRGRARVLTAAVELRRRIGQDFALPLLAEVPDACKELKGGPEQAPLLERALFVAAHFNQPGLVKDFVALLRNLLQARDFHQLLHTNQLVVDALLGQCFRGLRKMGLRDVIEQLLGLLTHAVLQGKKLDQIRDQDARERATLVRVLLQVASGWLYFGMNDQAKPIIEEARQLLFKDGLEPFDQRKLAWAYVNTLGQAPAETALRGIDELLSKLKGISDNYTTNSHYNLSQLEFVEAIVLAIVTEDFAHGSQASRWLDDDEYLIRKRIHQDVERAMRKG